MPQTSSSNMGSNRDRVSQGKSRASANDAGARGDEGEDDSESDEDKIGEEPEGMRVYPEFLKNLPGV